VWTLILALVVVPQVGVFAWSCYQPIEIGVRWRCVAFGRAPGDAESASDPNKHFISGRGSESAWWGVKLPGGQSTGWYCAGWVWQKSPHSNRIYCR
jgi:hypothetical protein